MATWVGWIVTDRNHRVITTVFYMADCDAEYVRTSLIIHDGYPSDIQVRRRK